MKIFSKRLKELRKDRKISLQKLGTSIGVSDTAVLKWEQGKSEPTATNIQQLALYFDVSADYLLGLEDETGAKTYNNFGIHNGDVHF